MALVAPKRRCYNPCSISRVLPTDWIKIEISRPTKPISTRLTHLAFTFRTCRGAHAWCLTMDCGQVALAMDCGQTAMQVHFCHDFSVQYGSRRLEAAVTHNVGR